LNFRLSPIFGQFITKDTMLFTSFEFYMQIGFSPSTYTGGINISAQGRYFFSTQATINFFLGLDVGFGIDLTWDYSNLHEHLITGIVAGFFLPFNQKIGLDLSLNPLFYIPLNSRQSYGMYTVLAVGILSSL
jgi:hypothetical protein